MTYQKREHSGSVPLSTYVDADSVNVCGGVYNVIPHLAGYEFSRQETVEFEKHIKKCSDCKKEIKNAKKFMKKMSNIQPLSMTLDKIV